MKKTALLIIFGLITFISHSQNESSQKEKNKKNSLAVSTGAPGFGIQYARKLSKKFNLIAAYHFFTIEDYSKDVRISNEPVNIIANLENEIFDLGLEYLPFKKSSFNLHAGMGYLSNTNLNAVFTYKNDVEYGEVVLSDEQIGVINADANWQGFCLLYTSPSPRDA